MSNQSIKSEARILAKRERNRSDYRRSTKTQEAVLLRLGVGEKQILDRAAANAGLSRSAFAQLYLVPIAAALTTERLQTLTQLTASRTVSLSTALATLIDTEIEKLTVGAPLSDLDGNVSLAFDELFDVNRAQSNGRDPDEAAASP